VRGGAARSADAGSCSGGSSSRGGCGCGNLPSSRQAARVLAGIMGQGPLHHRAEAAHGNRRAVIALPRDHEFLSFMFAVVGSPPNTRGMRHFCVAVPQHWLCHVKLLLPINPPHHRQGKCTAAVAWQQKRKQSRTTQIAPPSERAACKWQLVAAMQAMQQHWAVRIQRAGSRGRKAAAPSTLQPRGTYDCKAPATHTSRAGRGCPALCEQLRHGVSAHGLDMCNLARRSDGTPSITAMPPPHTR
jgi:hypothetical protein